MLTLRDMRLRILGRWPRTTHPHVVLTLEDRFTLCGIYRPTFPDVNVTTLMEGDGPICPRCQNVLEVKVSSVLDRIEKALGLSPSETAESGGS